MNKRKNNITEIDKAVRRFGSKVILEKIAELYQHDPKFNRFCEVFQQVFETDYENLDSKKIYVYNIHNEKKSLDKSCFVHLCVQNDFRFNLNALDYPRFMIFQANKAVKELDQRIPVHRVYLEKIKKFKELWQ